MLLQEGTTQGDPLAMVMFALASIPLIKKVATPGATQSGFADDASSGGRLRALRTWWDKHTSHMVGHHKSAQRKLCIYNENTRRSRQLQTAATIGGRLQRGLQKSPPHEQQCRNYMQTRPLLPTTLTKLTFWLIFLLCNALQQQPTEIYQVLIFLYPKPSCVRLLVGLGTHCTPHSAISARQQIHRTSPARTLS